MTQEGSKTLVVIGVVLGVLMALGCLVAGGLFFFTYRVAETKAVTVSVPAVAAPEPVVRVVVPADGTVFIDGEQVPEADLPNKLAKLHADLGDARVTLAADEKLPYQKLVAVMDAVKIAGFTKLAMQVRAPPAQ